MRSSSGKGRQLRLCAEAETKGARGRRRAFELVLADVDEARGLDGARGEVVDHCGRDAGEDGRMVVVSRRGGLEISTGCGLRLWVGVVVANSGPRFNVAAVVLFYRSLVGFCVP